ncbi:ribosome quality control complex subunit NEMF-like [Styela clava]
MKTRFTTLDISAVLTEINAKLVGMRLANVYDINNKTYLLKLAKPDFKAILLMESGIRLHISEFDWPKNMMPSGFSMKMRKHLKGRRLIYAKQLGVDRIVDMQFGTDDAAFHIILELYDRGNIILTDHQYAILNILRFRKDKAVSSNEGNADENSDVRIAVNETYPCDSAKQRKNFSEIKLKLEEVLKQAKNDDVLKRILNPHLPYGTACIEHCLLKSGFPINAKFGKEFNIENDLEGLFIGIYHGEELLDTLMKDCSNGWIVQKSEKKSDGTNVLTNTEFHPFLFEQHKTSPNVKYESFNKSVDEFFGSLESQKADMKILQQEKSANKKLDNIRKDHEQRLSNLDKEQETDLHKAQLIEENLTLVDQAIHVVRTAIANQIDWGEISSLIKDAQINEDPVAMSIIKLNLKSNEFTMALNEALDNSESEEASSDEDIKKSKKKKRKPVKVDIDIGLSAYSNAKKYYNKKRQASSKQQKIIDASGKALKSAEKKTKLSLKEAAVVHSIQKARKTFWFEKFLWFISSENFLVIGGRDAQQNEILVKRYLTGNDLYVHADLHGATSCIIKNPTSADVPPKTLNEAGTMAICHSAAWNAKVVTSAWWVHSHQVSKTAPSGEYLTTGSFLIRGKKNYLPPSYLVYGFGLVFKVEETCIHKHKDERKVSELQSFNGQDIPDSTATESISSELERELTIDSDTEGSDCEPETNSSAEPAIKDETKSDTADNEPQLGTVDAVMMDKKPTGIQFPDTNIQIKYAIGTNSADEEENPDVVYLGDEEPVLVKQNNPTSKPRISAKQRRDAKKKNQPNSSGDLAENDVIPPKNKDSPNPVLVNENPQQHPAKRGQRNKMKKLKSKYKDQDEEERLLKMELLQQSQSQKARDRKAKKAKSVAPQQKETKVQKQPRPKPAKSQENEYDSDEERNKVLENEHLSEESIGILNSLTGCPFPDDILMFALPVCAPYNTMHNYKFKVKLTPGNTKKGKGAKTALNLFQNMRDTTAQEKDHLRSIKDHDLAHNIPGKIKVSSTHLQLQKKKK